MPDGIWKRLALLTGTSRRAPAALLLLLDELALQPAEDLERVSREPPIALVAAVAVLELAGTARATRGRSLLVRSRDGQSHAILVTARWACAPASS